MNFEQHCKVTEIIFGNRHENVHKWLDLFYAKYRSQKHWQVRHHIKAIKEKYGVDTTKYLVAYLHIMHDWISHTAHAFVPPTPDDIEPELEKCNQALVKLMTQACDRGTF